MARDSKGTVSAQLSPRQLYAANMFLRSATRILVSAFKFRADSFPRLEHELRALDWSPWIDPRTTRLSLRVTSHSSALYHTGAIEEVIRQCLPLSMRSFLSAPQEQRVVVRLERDLQHLRVLLLEGFLHRFWERLEDLDGVQAAGAQPFLSRQFHWFLRVHFFPLVDGPLLKFGNKVLDGLLEA